MSIVSKPQKTHTQNDPDCVSCHLTRGKYFNPIDIEGDPMWIEPCLPANYSTFRKIIHEEKSSTTTRERLTYKIMKLITETALKNANEFKQRWVSTILSS